MGIIKNTIEEVASRTIRLYTSLIFIDKGGAVHIPENISKDDPRLTIGWRKPSPGMLEQAMSDLNVTARDTMMVGDRSEDVEAAKAAGCKFFYAGEFFEFEL